MNKTVNINLAGFFFHLDEEAYNKLQRYLEAIKRSFTDAQGRDEIIHDIEARISELFSEKIETDNQVITLKEVDEVIAVMGQPEDYQLDDEIFEDDYLSKKQPNYKQLYRDPDHKYIGGVSSGLGHYLGIDALWMRLLWVLLTIFSSGAFILIYIVFWIFVPEAHTTAEKLAMRGEAVNISNIEKKVREGFDTVASKVKDVNYDQYSNKAKSGVSAIVEAIGKIIMFCLKVFVKIIGVFLLLIGGVTLIALFIGLFSVGTFGIIDAPWTDYVEMANVGAPIWVVSILIFFAVGIPFFFVFYLGLKILVKKLKSIGTTAKFVLLGLWLVCLSVLVALGIRQATQRAFDADVVKTEILPITPSDTLSVRMKNNPLYNQGYYKHGDFKIKYDSNGNKILYTQDVALIVRSTQDSVASIQVLKNSEGSDYNDAKRFASNIEYNYTFTNNTLALDSYLTANPLDKFHDQEVEVTLFIPVGTTLYVDKNASSYHRNNWNSNDILEHDMEEHYLTIAKDKVICESCPIDEDDDDWDSDDDEINARLNINNQEVEVKINKNGVEVNKEKVNSIKIDENGIEINKVSNDSLN
ncbi:PspC domain-containing protein [Croceibacter atlanticus]|jgi:phage shock protein PspC (stress-responsive transcriptional regulator)|uniref:PspC domain-containing protein n=1 Tax=Croceibacter atlanticus TaxID=313588 RepID=UPI0024BB1E0A|nr:PspC domain-containing protein [Croceibacter atlanticus]